METHLAYCAALDREVRVLVRQVSYDEVDGVVVPTPGILCVEHAEECLGNHCPLLDAPLDMWLAHLDCFRR